MPKSLLLNYETLSVLYTLDQRRILFYKNITL